MKFRFLNVLITTKMNSYNKLLELINSKKNYLCVGLDTDYNKIPEIFKKNNNYNISQTIIDYNNTIIENTKDKAISYKINFAFYEELGSRGFDIIEKALDIIPNNIFTIADAKRGDIGNTSKSYAKSVFDYFKFDSITISPYMGEDSISPFLEYEDKITFLLCLTSNKGSNDLQRLNIGKFSQKLNSEMTLYQYVMDKYSEMFNYQNIGFVVGATHPNEILELRKLNDKSVFLIPGIGAQGGDLENTLINNNKFNKNSPCLINVSRAIIYPEIDNKDCTIEQCSNKIKIKCNDFTEQITNYF